MSTPAGGQGQRADSGPRGRAQRVDARANRGRILDAAEEVFGQGGESASTEEVARLAGVGIGTVFRHFPTKAALLEAVLEREFGRLREHAAALLDAADPGAAFRDLFSHLAERGPAKVAITEALLDEGGELDGDADVNRAADGLREDVGVLLQRAQQAGAVRGDVELPEVYALLAAISRAGTRARLDPDARTRLLVIVFDGLEPRDRSTH
jgi:AcrR family transcriptional regulator